MGNVLLKSHSSDSFGVTTCRGDAHQRVQILLAQAKRSRRRRVGPTLVDQVGDAVLGLLVAHWLYERFPEMAEGDLSKLKSYAVSIRRRMCP